jgi:hypothetical protein
MTAETVCSISADDRRRLNILSAMKKDEIKLRLTASPH